MNSLLDYAGSDSTVCHAAVTVKIILCHCSVTDKGSGGYSNIFI